MRELFEDTGDGAFFSTAAGDRSLVLRMKDDYDGAEPSGNAVALLDLLRLAHFTDRADYREAAERTLRALGSKIAQQSVAVPQMLVGLDYYLAPRREVVAGRRASARISAPHSRAISAAHHHAARRRARFSQLPPACTRSTAIPLPTYAKNYTSVQLPVTSELSEVLDELLQ